MICIGRDTSGMLWVTVITTSTEMPWFWVQHAFCSIQSWLEGPYPTADELVRSRQ